MGDREKNGGSEKDENKAGARLEKVVSMDKGQEKHLEERMCRQGSILR